MANPLSIRRADTFEEQARLFTTDKETGYSLGDEITNEELIAAERQDVDALLNEFFDFENGLDDLVENYKEDIEMLAEKNKDDVIKRADLKANTEDPYHLKEYEKQRTVFSRKVLEDKKESLVGTMDYSTSTDYVKTDIPKTSSGYATRSSNRSYGSSTSSTYGTKSTTSYGTSSTKPNGPPKSGDEINLSDRISYVAENVMDVAIKPVKGWTDRVEETGWGSGKKSWKRKIKSFFKSKKANVLLKTGMLMTLQLGMAMVGKKYKFEGAGQTAAFLGMMMGVFYLTRELAEDGFDPRGFGIL